MNTLAPALGPEDIERQITLPVELSLGGMKGLKEVRSISKFGLSQVVAIFEDNVDIYFARQQINERLLDVPLPKGIERPTMGPVATGVGEVYHYYMSSDVYDLTELRTLHDWVVRPRLRRVPGVAEVNAWGGEVKQYEVRFDPIQLAKYKLTLDDLVTALEANNENVGGGGVERAGEFTVVQGVGMARSTEEIASIVLTAIEGVPIRVKDVAEVRIGHMIRRGAITANGKGEVVLGLGFMRMGENTRDVTIGLDEAMNDVRKILPPGVKMTVGYRRTDLVNQVLETVKRNLFEGAVLVVAVLFAFLGNFRAGLIVASAIPLSMLFAVTMMDQVGIAGSLMSLGAIDFGLVVDSSVVMVENCVRHLAHAHPGRGKLAVIRDAAIEVRKPTMFGELIIMIVYLPILTLQGVEGKLFRPMALTVIFALGASMVLSLTLMPALASLGLSRKVREKETLVDRFFHWLYRPLLRFGMGRPIVTLILVGRPHDRHDAPRPDPRLRVHPEARRGVGRHRHDPPGEHRAERVDPVRDEGRAGPDEGVPRRDRARLDPHRHARAGDRPDGLGTERRLHHLEAPIALEEGEDAGGAGLEDGRGDGPPAGPGIPLHAADRAAH